MEGIAGNDRVAEVTTGEQQGDGAQLVVFLADRNLGEGRTAAVLHQTNEVGWGAAGGRTAQGLAIHGERL